MAFRHLVYLVLTAVLIYVFQAPIRYLLSPFLDNKLFGLYVVPDWSSLMLLLVFSLGLVIEIYRGFYQAESRIVCDMFR